MPGGERVSRKYEKSIRRALRYCSERILTGGNRENREKKIPLFSLLPPVKFFKLVRCSTAYTEMMNMVYWQANNLILSGRGQP